MNYNCFNFLDLRNLQEQVKKAFCYQKLFWPFTVWINWPNDLKNFAYSRPSASNFKSFSRTLEQFFLTVGQNNFGNKIPFFFVSKKFSQGKNTNEVLVIVFKCSLERFKWVRFHLNAIFLLKKSLLGAIEPLITLA